MALRFLLDMGVSPRVVSVIEAAGHVAEHVADLRMATAPDEALILQVDSAVHVSPAEFNRRLDELSKGLPPLATLRADWSRADLYGDHN